MRNVFIIGPDEFNRKVLANVGRKAGVTFHKLLDFHEVCVARRFDFHELLRKAQSQLDSFDGSIDGILAVWDFPSTMLMPILARNNDLSGAPPEAVLRCEHKWWSRVLQKEVIPDQVPDFQTVDPFMEPHRMEIEVDFPFWIKPIKAHSSAFGFKVAKMDHLSAVLPTIRKGIHRLGEPFDQAMEVLQAPVDLIRHGGRYCLLEGIIGGLQCTAEGYVSENNVTVYGIIDSHRYEGLSSFHRYQYPSTLPPEVQDRIRESCRKVIPKMGLKNSCFNIEFFYDETTDDLWLLEINPRCSQSHADLFEKVDGDSHLNISLAMALGDEIDWKSRAGRFNCAAKFFLRAFSDGFVRKMPSAKKVEEIISRHPEAFIDLQATEGSRLSDQTDQDSYSFEVARVYLGAANEAELLERYRDCKERLEEEIEIASVASLGSTQ